MFTVLKVREGITSYDDPGWYKHPEGTRARKAYTSRSLSQRSGTRYLPGAVRVAQGGGGSARVRNAPVQEGSVRGRGADTEVLRNEARMTPQRGAQRADSGLQDGEHRAGVGAGRDPSHRKSLRPLRLGASRGLRDGGPDRDARGRRGGSRVFGDDDVKLSSPMADFPADIYTEPDARR